MRLGFVLGFIGSLVHWFTGSRVYWFTGSSAPNTSAYIETLSIICAGVWAWDSLVQWFISPKHQSIYIETLSLSLVHWFTGLLVYWFISSSAPYNSADIERLSLVYAPGLWVLGVLLSSKHIDLSYGSMKDQIMKHGYIISVLHTLTDSMGQWRIR